jgi:hypothetical protein
MELNVSSVLDQGAKRTLARNGLALMGVLFVLGAVAQLLGLGAAQWAAGQPSDAGTAAAALAAGLASLVLSLATVVVSIGAIRVFVSEETERLPREYFTHRMAWAVVNFIVGAIVFGIVVALGFVALVVPGIFLLVTLAFWTVYVAVDDRNFVAGFRESWALTRGHRLKLLVIGASVLFVSLLVSAIFGLGAALGSTVGVVFAQIGAAITSVFTTATLARAYVALRAVEGPGGEGIAPSGDESAPSTDPVGSL